VVAVDEKERRRSTDDIEKRPLPRIHIVNGGLAERLSADQPLDAEVVAHHHVEVRSVFRYLAERSLVQARVVHLAFALWMRVSLDVKGESGTRRALRLERAPQTGPKSIISCRTRGQTIEVPQVGLQGSNLELDRHACANRARVRMLAVVTNNTPVLDPRVEVRRRQDAQRDRAIGRPAENQGQVCSGTSCAGSLSTLRA
jgi:hypothetical protein